MNCESCVLGAYGACSRVSALPCCCCPLTAASFPVYKIDMMFPEYEKFTEPELIKLLKQLERQKQDLISQLKNVQYQTDKESKASTATAPN